MFVHPPFGEAAYGPAIPDANLRALKMLMWYFKVAYRLGKNCISSVSWHYQVTIMSIGSLWFGGEELTVEPFNQLKFSKCTANDQLSIGISDLLAILL